MKKKILCPSMMCADFSMLKDEVAALQAAKIDIFHLDVMDGRFVPNFGMGLQDIQAICKWSETLVDVHLMIEDPGAYVEKFADMGVDIIYFHPEADRHPTRTINKIKQKGKQAGIAINPGTSVAMIEELLPLIDYVMVMTVDPGFSGQAYLTHVEGKIKQLAAVKERYSYQLMADGAISPAVMTRLSALDVDGFVLGTSALFGKEESYQELISIFKEEDQA